jgi:type I restriction enzyme S subunit
MSKSAQQSKIHNIPKLRFPGFKGVWEEKRLGGFGDVVGGGTPDTTRPEYWNGDINWFTPTEIKQKYTQNSLRKISDKGLKDSSAKLLPVGTLLFTSRATVGDISISTVECSTNQGFQSIITNRDTSNEFLYYWIIKNRNEFIRRANGSTFLEISGKEMRKMRSFFPILHEQQKIATFLGSVDLWIENLRMQKEVYESYKKGMMQKIFSQEIRFKDDEGKAFPKWEEKRLGEVGRFRSGQGFGNVEQGGENGTPFYKVSDMNSIGNEKLMITANHYVTNEQVSRLKYKIIKDKSIIFAKVGAAIFLERKRMANSFLIDNNMMAFTPKGNIEFMRYVFERIRLSRFAQVGALPSYNASDLSIIKTRIPVSEDEQQKIAGILTSIDKVIESKQQQITQAEQWKKGLMQELFV